MRKKPLVLLLLAFMLSAGACEKTAAPEQGGGPSGRAETPDEADMPSGAANRPEGADRTPTSVLVPFPKQDALAVAQRYDASPDLEWTAEYVANFEWNLGHEKLTFNAWIVTATYPSGNRLVVYIDADSGAEIAMSEIEAGDL